MMCTDKRLLRDLFEQAVKEEQAHYGLWQRGCITKREYLHYLDAVRALSYALSELMAQEEVDR